MRRNYWEAEEPITIQTERYDFVWYPQAKRLELHRHQWIGGDGREYRAKRLTLNVAALKLLSVEERRAIADVLNQVIESIE